MHNPTRVIATVFALTGFTVALLAGLLAGNLATTVLTHAIVALAACYVIGSIVGEVGLSAVNRHIETLGAAQPAPESSEASKSSPSSETSAQIVDKSGGRS